MKNKLIALFFSLLLIGDFGRLWAAPQPVLDSTEAEQLRSLAFGISNGTSLIVHSRQVDKVICSGAGSSSKYGFAEEGGMIKEILWLRLHNAGSEAWSGASIEFMPNTDVSRYNSIVIWVRALESNQRLLVTLQDRSWKDKVKPQALSPYFPLWGLPEHKILQVVIPFKALTRNASIDFARLSRLGFQFGRKTAGNIDGDIIEVLGVAFVHQPEDSSRILFVDLTGKVEKHPSARVKAIAPAPTHVPRPEFSPEQIAKPVPLPHDKSARIDFAVHPTYFGPISAGVTIFREPFADSQPLGVLEEGKSYLGLRSQKIGNERWFMLDLDGKISGWVPSADVEFADPPKK